MTWYNQGTISLTNGGATVSGDGTDFIQYVRAGDALHAPDGNIYEITGIVSATELTLAQAYMGATEAGATYSIQPTPAEVRALAARVAELVNNYSGYLETALKGRFGNGTQTAPSIAFEEDLDSGFEPLEANIIGAIAGGHIAFRWGVNGLQPLGILTRDPEQALDVRGVIQSKAIVPGLQFSETTQTNLMALTQLVQYLGRFEVQFRDADGDWQVTPYRIERGSDGAATGHYWMLGVSPNNSESMRLTPAGLGVGVGSEPQAIIHAKQQGNFDPADAKANLALMLENKNGVQGDGNYGPALLLSKINSTRPGGAIASMQTSGDADQMGLAFFTHQASSGTNELELKMVLDHAGNLGIGVADPQRDFHLYSPTTNSARMRIENEEGWADLIADAAAFRVATNATGETDNRQYLTFYGHGRLDWTGDAVTNTQRLVVGTENLSFTSDVARLQTHRSASSAFDFLEMRSSAASGADVEFRVRGNGDVRTDGDYTAGGADVAEYHEFADGNPDNEDRAGYPVVLIGEKIRIAEEGETPFGVISAQPSVVSDGDIDRWKKKYLCDEFGRCLYEDFTVVTWTEITETETIVREPVTETIEQQQTNIEVIDGLAVQVTRTVMAEQAVIDEYPVVDEAGAPIMETVVIGQTDTNPPEDITETRQVIHRVQRMQDVTKVERSETTHSAPLDELPDGVTLPDDATYTTEKRRMLNPDYDPNLEYVARENRPEWAPVGVLGKLYVREGYPVNSRWQRMTEPDENGLARWWIC